MRRENDKNTHIDAAALVGAFKLPGNAVLSSETDWELRAAEALSRTMNRLLDEASEDWARAAKGGDA